MHRVKGLNIAAASKAFFEVLREANPDLRERIDDDHMLMMFMSILVTISQHKEEDRSLEDYIRMLKTAHRRAGIGPEHKQLGIRAFETAMSAGDVDADEAHLKSLISGFSSLMDRVLTED